MLLTIYRATVVCHKESDLVLQISVKDEKAKLFLELIEALKSSMVDKYQIISDDTLFDEKELLKRSDEIKNKKIKAISRKEVFDGLC